MKINMMILEKKKKDLLLKESKELSNKERKELLIKIWKKVKFALHVKEH